MRAAASKPGSQWRPAAPIWRASALYGAIALAGALMEILASGRSVALVLHGGLIDPDSFMRLVRIEQGIRLGHLLNMVQRDDGGVPLLIEWSRLFDAVIVALAAPLVPWLGWHHALFVAGVATGPLSAGCFSAAAAFAIAPIAQRRWLWMVPLVGLLLPGLRGFATFGIIHYHIAQIAAVAATSGFALRAGMGRAAAYAPCGIAGGVALWLMPETMPFVLLCFVGLGSVWLFQPIGAALLRLGLWFAATLAVALLLDPPHGGIMIAEIDRLSIVYATLGLAVATAGIWLNRLDRWRLQARRRGSAGVAGALAVFALWLAVFPGVALGPYGVIPARDMAVFFGHMSETQPVDTLPEAAMLLGPGLLALAYTGYRAGRARRDHLHGVLWLLLSAGVALSLALTARFVIFQQYPAGFAAALLPVALSEASIRWKAQPRRAAGARIGAIGLVLIAPYAPSFAVAAIAPAAGAKPPACRLRHIAPMLRAEAGAVVLSPPETVPELLYRTRIIAVGSLYQHGIAGYLRAWHAWRAPATTESTAFAASDATFVLFCPGGPHDPLADHAQPTALWSLLSTGHTPPWLIPIAQDGANGFRLYRVEPPLSGNRSAPSETVSPNPKSHTETSQ
jgi:hypothetical protein